MDPLRGSNWSRPETVAGFSRSPPNATLMAYAADLLHRRGGRGVALDLGCGAGRNAVPLAEQGWDVIGTDLSLPMLDALAGRLAPGRLTGRLFSALAPMDRVPVTGRSMDLIVAHGIWNLARSSREFRRAVREAARVAKPGAGLFIFTFSRHTLPRDAAPVPDEPFVFTQFSGEPQCFLTSAQLVAEMEAAGFLPDPLVPLREHNRPPEGTLRVPAGPVIYEGAFRMDALR